jgi:hypothetical protein
MSKQAVMQTTSEESIDYVYCPECGEELDRMGLLQMIPIQNGEETIMVCRDCAMDKLRNDIIEDRGYTIEGLEYFYLCCQRSHYMHYLIDDWKFIMENKPTIFCDIWDDLESNLIWIYKSIWIDMLTSIKDNNICIMYEEDKKKWDELPKKFRIYRGSAYEDGLSWTLSREKAEWFRDRFCDQDAKVWKRYVKKSDCVAYLNGRGEQEIIYLGSN